MEPITIFGGLLVLLWWQERQHSRKHAGKWPRK
jgi:hypothetical protein